MYTFDADFIKSRKEFKKGRDALSKAPIFRRRFSLTETKNAILQFSALGIGYVYINGHKVTNDLFLSPFTEYSKLVIYNEYDVSHLLKKGENVIALILGNGFFNENIETTWHTHELPWRDSPKVALALYVDGEKVLESDEEFLCSDTSFVTYNELRSGETFDARLYDESWKEYSFDDSGFEPAMIDATMRGIRRDKCVMEPIREIAEYDFVDQIKVDGGYVLDFGVNISGYVRVDTDLEEGTVLEMHHSEELNPDNTLNLNKMDCFYIWGDFQVDRYICGKKNFSWSPKFTYHGFRYVLVKGLTRPAKAGEFKAVFVHQDIRKKADFCCSDELLNKIYKAAIHSSYSNMHHVPTDCPTREKLGWTNDMQASVEQLYMNFDIERFLYKWSEDILVNVGEDGSVSGVAPGFFDDRKCGPVCDGILATLPMITYLYLGRSDMLIKFLPALEKHYKLYVDRFRNGEPLWLCDWDGHGNRFEDMTLLHYLYKHKFCEAIIFAKDILGADKLEYEADLKDTKEKLKELYINEEGRCIHDHQTPISMLISLGVSPKEPLLKQLKERIEKDGFHHTSGMLGFQFLFPVLFENGLASYAYKLLTAKGGHTYSYWMENGSGTLWETWEQGHTDSRNHHMLSGPTAQFFKGFLGIAPKMDSPAYEEIDLRPCFIDELSFCKGYIETPRGKIEAEWKREEETITYRVMLPEKIKATFNGQSLNEGENLFYIKKESSK